MAEEPQPDNPPPAGEDRKTAAALENLSSTADDGADANTSNADTVKLGNALSSLNVTDKKDEVKTDVAKDDGGSSAPAKKIKIDQADVAFLVDQLEVSKNKATEMLRAHSGDKNAAMTAFVVPSAKA